MDDDSLAIFLPRNRTNNTFCLCILRRYMSLCQAFFSLHMVASGSLLCCMHCDHEIVVYLTDDI